jgi:hypothetical protein
VSTAAADRVARVALLGLRFVDAAFDQPVADGLVVTLWPATRPSRRLNAASSGSGTWVVHDAPGLAAFAHGDGSAASWAAAPSPSPWVVNVADALGRFLPARFPVGLPARWPFDWTCPASPPPSPPAAPWLGRPVPLYSSPTRTVAGPVGVIRAQLWDLDASAPAAWAVMDATAGGRTTRGLADESGRLTILLPYPEDDAITGGDALDASGSPIPGPSGPLSAHSWTVVLTASHQPGPPPAEVPALCPTLTQPPARLWVDAGRTTPLTQVTLQYGRELILRSQDAAPGRPNSVLWLSQ